jgi:hypothetical protein
VVSLTLPRSGERTLGHIQQQAGCSPWPVLLSTEQRCTFKDITSLCLIFVRHRVYLQSTKYRISLGGGPVLLTHVIEFKFKGVHPIVYIRDTLYSLVPSKHNFYII